MSSTPAPGDTLPTAESGLTTDELFGVLTARRRRDVLHVLRRQGETDHEPLARALDGTGRDVTAVELHHLVLPRLEGAGLVSLGDDGTVTLTDGGRAVATWLETVTDGWS